MARYDIANMYIANKMRDASDAALTARVTALETEMDDVGKFTALWTNENPTSGMAGDTTITLSSSDYDLLLMIPKVTSESSNIGSPVIIPKGMSGYGQIANGSAIVGRVLTRVSDTEYTAGAPYAVVGSTAQGNIENVPLIIYGIKI